MSHKLQVEIHANVTPLIRGLERAHLHIAWLEFRYWLRARRRTA